MSDKIRLDIELSAKLVLARMNEIRGEGPKLPEYDTGYKYGAYWGLDEGYRIGLSDALPLAQINARANDGAVDITGPWYTESVGEEEGWGVHSDGSDATFWACDSEHAADLCNALNRAWKSQTSLEATAQRIGVAAESGSHSDATEPTQSRVGEADAPNNK